MQSQDKIIFLDKTEQSFPSYKAIRYNRFSIDEFKGKILGDIVYFLFDKTRCVYVGQTKNGLKRIKSHKTDFYYKKKFDSFSVLYSNSKPMAEYWETFYIFRYSPKYNIKDNWCKPKIKHINLIKIEREQSVNYFKYRIIGKELLKKDKNRLYIKHWKNMYYSLPVANRKLEYLKKDKKLIDKYPFLINSEICGGSL